MSEDDIRRFTVLLENIQGHVQVIAEGHGALVTRMDRVEGKVDAMAEDLAIVKLDLSGVKHDLSGVKHDLSGVKHDLSGVRLDTGSLDGRVHRIEDHLGLNGASRPKKAAAKKPTSKKR